MGKTAELVPVRTLELGDMSLSLRGDLRAFRIFKQVTGKSILRGEVEIDEDTIPPLLFAAAASADRSLWDYTAAAPMPGAEVTLEAIEDAINLGNIARAVEAATGMLMDANAAMEEGDSGNRKRSRKKTKAGSST